MEKAPSIDLYLPAESGQGGCSGNSLAIGSSTGSESPKHKKLNLTALLRAQNRAEEVEKEFQLMRARNEVRLAELELDSDGASVVDVQVDPQDKVKDYLAGVVSSTPMCEALAVQPTSCVVKAFDGNPRCYWRSIQEFKFHIEDSVQDSGQRMLYVIHYCRGPAKEAAAECVMLPPEIAYGRAREILKDLFGREHMVARAILDDQFKKLKPLHDDADSLSRLSINPQNCHVSLSQMNHPSDMHPVSTIERILRTLSKDARRNWARLADSMGNLGKQIGFSDLRNFVSQAARIARSRCAMTRALFATKDMDRRSVVGSLTCQCKQDGKCGIENCLLSHHHLLHVMPDANKSTLVGLCNSTSQTESGTCIGVVPVCVNGPQGSVLTYVLLDRGSDVTLVTKDLLDEVVSGTSTVQATSLRIEFESADSGETVVTEQAFAIRYLPVSPSVMSPKKIASQYNDLKDTTLVEFLDKRVRILIGDVPGAHWPMEKRLGKQKECYALKTLLGWVLIGPLSIGHRVWRHVHHVSMKKDDITAHLKAPYEADFNDLEIPAYRIETQLRLCFAYPEVLVLRVTRRYRSTVTRFELLKSPQCSKMVIGKYHYRGER
ncbi:hypothetical protein T265_06278 [Opisthorchis viverrini]|uniref:Uncharacterized protein n=1 Tax=Opisthorchis viverrini TaxID=6198 RepID=A0A074ZH07_OPIVI|nr:hypothetical protein T265_06278 [Opisthorchis viverrini]KER26488.1 hypothetical protein T265_06278 [Opisthorchis viverrini]